MKMVILKPIEVRLNIDEDLKQAIKFMRSGTRANVEDSDSARKLATNNVATSDAVTLTMNGYEGYYDSKNPKRMNQDRSIVVSPYTIESTSFILDKDSIPSKEKTEFLSAFFESFLTKDRVLLGVFDGYGPLGENVAEYTANNLPSVLNDKLKESMLKYSKYIIPPMNAEDIDEWEIMCTKSALDAAFEELDRTAPSNEIAGCTASVVLSQGNHVYIANAGDSESFIVGCRPSDDHYWIELMSEKNKPSDPDERKRIERMGGEIEIPPFRSGLSCRVNCFGKTSGKPISLAMSRAIGCRDARSAGVIPNPRVQHMSIDQIGNRTLKLGVDDVYIFAVCVTDGMTVSKYDIAKEMGRSLYASTGNHPVAAAEKLVNQASSNWIDRFEFDYQDDITIAVASLRKPSLSQNAIE